MVVVRNSMQGPELALRSYHGTLLQTMSEPELVLSPATDASLPRTKRVPDASVLQAHAYAPSDDGTDENLLILLHGLGPCPRPYI
jgi:hypothetical protein